MQVIMPFTANESLALTLPWDDSDAVLRPQEVAAATNEDALIAASLDVPLGRPRLEEMVRPQHKVLIIIDDNTRPTPVARIMPHILERLQRAGVPDKNINILVASGTHRLMTQDEIRAKVGNDIAQRFAITCHRCHDISALTRVGISPEGIEVWLNRAVVEADFLIGIGNVVPHPHTGWAGGAKILYPGVAGAKTIGAFHLIGADEPTNYLGRADAPARHSLERLANIVGLDFVVNTVLTREHRLYKVFCGEHQQAQMAARQAAWTVYGLPVTHRYNVVIVNSYPAYLEFWQAGKGIFAADLVLKPGGTIILVAPCPEGVGVTHPSQVEYLAMEPEKLLRKIANGHAEDPIAAAVCAKVTHIKRRAQIVVVSPWLKEAEVRSMGFAYYPDLYQALANIGVLDKSGQEVAIITHGGETVPYIRGGDVHIN